MKLQVSQEDEAGTDEDNNDNNDNQERMGWDRMAGWQGGPRFNLANNIDTNVMYYLTSSKHNDFSSMKAFLNKPEN